MQQHHADNPENMCIGMHGLGKQELLPSSGQIKLGHRNQKSNKEQVQHFHVFRMLNGRIDTFDLKCGDRKEFSENGNYGGQ